MRKPFSVPDVMTDRDHLLQGNAVQMVFCHYRPEMVRLEKAIEKARYELTDAEAERDPELEALRSKIDPIRSLRHDEAAFNQALAEVGMTPGEYQAAVLKICYSKSHLRPLKDRLRDLEIELDDFEGDVQNETEELCYIVGKREGFRVGMSAVSRLLAGLTDPALPLRLLAAYSDDATADALLQEFGPAHLEAHGPATDDEPEEEEPDTE